MLKGTKIRIYNNIINVWSYICLICVKFSESLYEYLSKNGVIIFSVI